MNHSLEKLVRWAVLLLAYSLVFAVSLFVTVQLRFDFEVPALYQEILWKSLLWVVPVKLALLALAGQFRSLLTFFSLPDAKRIAVAVLAAGVFQLVVWYATAGEGVLPRGVIVTDAIVSFLGLSGLRTALRLYREKFTDPPHSRSPRRRVAIFGAGASGAALFMDIRKRPGLGLDVVCFIDDDAGKIGSALHGRPILGPRKSLAKIARDLELQKVIIAIPPARPALVKELVAEINRLQLDHEILPSVAQLLHRQVTVSHLRRVDPEDLLGRESVSLDEGDIADLIRGKNVLVTGAGGSIGSELCRQIAVNQPGKLILVERSEPALFAIEQELLGSCPRVNLAPCATNVCDEDAMSRIMRAHRPDLVFHAAAHKHVPLMEGQPAEALRNNSIGTEIAARLSRDLGVRKFVLVSTDKAVNPTNVMGASKRLAEMLLENYHRQGGDCAFAAVRFGNVLGSSGSVVPTFRRQISEGGPVTVTHPDVTRYFMSIPEAVGLILQSACQAKGGEIFVLDMGEPVKISDLARQMIELSGFVPEEDIKIAFTGLRPGEKLYEEPIHEMENVEPTSHPKVRRLRNDRSNASGDLTGELVLILEDAGDNPQRLRAWLGEKIPEYSNSG